MKVVSVVSVVFLVTCTVSGNSDGPFKESRNLDGEKLERAVPDNYKPVGCYSLKKLKKLKIFGKEAYKKTKATSATPFDQCIPEAMKNNYEIIGIQTIKKNIIYRKGNERQWKSDAAIKKLSPKNCKKDVGSKKSIFIYRKSQSQNPGTCIANNKIYHDGDDIVFHNVTSPIEDAACNSCRCSSGNIADCVFTYCDFGLRDFPPEVCDNWITGQEGVCCPRCEACKTNADPWVKHLKSGGCHECSCKGEHVKCSDRITCLDCPGITEPVPGKCCPKCITTPKPQTTRPVFTIQLETTTVFPPFSFRKRSDVTSRDEQFDDEEYDKMEQWKPRD